MQTLYTAGTTGMTHDRFIALLRECQTDAVIDIRLRTEGARYRFASGRQIRDLSVSQGVQYLHELTFAPTAEMMKRIRADHDWDRYVASYVTLIQQRGMLAVWQQVAGKFERPCLLCAEKSAVHCQRRLLATALVGASVLEVMHL